MSYTNPDRGLSDSSQIQCQKSDRFRSGLTSSDHLCTSLATLLGLHEGIVIFAAFVQEAIIELHKSSIHVLCSEESHKTSVQYKLLFLKSINCFKLLSKCYSY